MEEFVGIIKTSVLTRDVHALFLVGLVTIGLVAICLTINPQYLPGALLPDEI